MKTTPPEIIKTASVLIHTISACGLSQSKCINILLSSQTLQMSIEWKHRTKWVECVTHFVIGGAVFLWGRGGVSTGAVWAITAVTLAVQAESGRGTRWGQRSFTQTDWQSVWACGSLSEIRVTVRMLAGLATVVESELSFEWNISWRSKISVFDANFCLKSHNIKRFRLKQTENHGWAGWFWWAFLLQSCCHHRLTLLTGSLPPSIVGALTKEQGGHKDRLC